MIKSERIFIPAIEWPTILLLGITYSAWLLVLFLLSSAGLGWFALGIAPFAGYTMCLHSSLQHECLHGHPTRSQQLNDALVFLPLLLWLPYKNYKHSHLKHHKCDELTHPEQDPESYYFAPHIWHAMPRWKKAIFRINNTLIGRLVVGPIIAICQNWIIIAKDIKRDPIMWIGDSRHYILGLVIVCFLVTYIFSIPLWQYIVFAVWPATGFMLLRSYYEHKPAIDNARSTAIVESNLFFSLLFLNNNFHVIHHEHPQVPWYQLARMYYAQPNEWLKHNGDYYFKGYAKLLLTFGIVPKDSPMYRQQ